MAIRISTTELKHIINTSVAEGTLNSHIEVASHLIDDILGSSGLSTARLKDIELYLSAHFTSIYNPSSGQVTEMKMGDTTETYGFSKAKLGQGLDLTTFGQQVLVLDTTGALAALGQRTALLSMFGHTPP